MARAKDEVLIRIACANCRQAELDRASAQEEAPPRFSWNPLYKP